MLYLFIYLFILARSQSIIAPGSANLEFWRQNKQTKNKKNLSAVFD